MVESNESDKVVIYTTDMRAWIYLVTPMGHTTTRRLFVMVQ